MIHLLSEAKEYIKYKLRVTDNFTFWLHYRLTFTVLFVASLLTTANQLVGDKINCMVEHVPNDVMNSYCWIQGTFTIPSQHNEKNVIHPGVTAPTAYDNAYNDITMHDTEDTKGHAWYQWVSFILFGQALLFYMPHYLWKASEGGKLSAIVKDLDGYTIAGRKEKNDDDETVKKEKRWSDIAEYLLKNSGSHKRYSWLLAFEFLNLANAVMQAYLIDLFLGNEFTRYGTEVLGHYFQPSEERDDPMSKVFPRITKCTFKQTGTSGTNENWDAICILPINMINEKVFIIIWFWFIVLIIWTAVHLMIQILILSIKPLRVQSLLHKCRLLDPENVSRVLKGKFGGKYGDYVLLRQMAMSMDPFQFNEVMQLVERKNSNRPNTGSMHSLA